MKRKFLKVCDAPPQGGAAWAACRSYLTGTRAWLHGGNDPVLPPLSGGQADSFKAGGERAPQFSGR